MVGLLFLGKILVTFVIATGSITGSIYVAKKAITNSKGKDILTGISRVARRGQANKLNKIEKLLKSKKDKTNKVIKQKIKYYRRAKFNAKYLHRYTLADKAKGNYYIGKYTKTFGLNGRSRREWLTVKWKYKLEIAKLKAGRKSSRYNRWKVRRATNKVSTVGTKKFDKWSDRVRKSNGDPTAKYRLPIWKLSIFKNRAIRKADKWKKPDDVDVFIESEIEFNNKKFVKSLDGIKDYRNSMLALTPSSAIAFENIVKKYSRPAIIKRKTIQTDRFSVKSNDRVLDKLEPIYCNSNDSNVFVLGKAVLFKDLLEKSENKNYPIELNDNDVVKVIKDKTELIEEAKKMQEKLVSKKLTGDINLDKIIVDNTMYEMNVSYTGGKKDTVLSNNEPVEYQKEVISFLDKLITDKSFLKNGYFPITLKIRHELSSKIDTIESKEEIYDFIDDLVEANIEDLKTLSEPKKSEYEELNIMLEEVKKKIIRGVTAIFVRASAGTKKVEPYEIMEDKASDNWAKLGERLSLVYDYLKNGKIKFPITIEVLSYPDDIKAGDPKSATKSLKTINNYDELIDSFDSFESRTSETIALKKKLAEKNTAREEKAEALKIAEAKIEADKKAKADAKLKAAADKADADKAAEEAKKKAEEAAKAIASAATSTKKTLGQRMKEKVIAVLGGVPKEVGVKKFSPVFDDETGLGDILDEGNSAKFDAYLGAYLKNNGLEIVKKVPEDTKK